jgi:hypothetical protein
MIKKICNILKKLNLRKSPKSKKKTGFEGVENIPLCKLIRPSYYWD